MIFALLRKVWEKSLMSKRQRNDEEVFKTWKLPKHEDEEILVAVPWSITMRMDACDYYNRAGKCSGGLTTQYGESLRDGIMACDEHAAWAKRDIAAFYHEKGYVRVDAFLGRFPHLSHDEQKIVVPRTDGTTVKGCIRQTSVDENNFVFLTRGKDNVWHIPVMWCDGETKKTKNMSVAQLVLSGFEVDSIIRALEEGFYVEQHTAQAEVLDKKD
jgi:hypothetical protein